MMWTRQRWLCLLIVVAGACAPALAEADGLRKLETAERIVLAEALWPTITPLADGSLGVVYQKARYSKVRNSVMPNVAMEWIRSTDGGKTWSKPVIVAERRSRDGKLFANRDDGGYIFYRQRNQALGQLPSGRIVCAMVELDYHYDTAGKAEKMNDYGSTFKNMGKVYTWSDDLGRTWVRTRKLPTGSVGGGSPHWRIVSLKDGTALMTFYGQYNRPAKPPNKGTGVLAGVIRSTDNGTTWGDISLIFTRPSLVAWEETALCLLEDDVLLAHMRTGRHNIVQFTSIDLGRTWQGPTDVTEPGQQPGGAFRLASGKLMTTWGNRRPPYGAAAMLSYDNGKTWDYEHRVSLEWGMPNANCGYANGAQAGDGTIVVVYYGTGKARAVRFTEEQFLAASR